MKCVICGRAFEAHRNDAKCCSSNCRHKLARERKRLNGDYQKRNWQLEDRARLDRLLLESPSIESVIEDFRFYFGRDVALVVIKTCEALAADIREGFANKGGVQ